MVKIGSINSAELEKLIKQANPMIDNASSVLANEIKRCAKDFTPYRDGGLQGSLKFERKDGRVVGITYDIEYASKMYFGDPNWRYNRSKNTQAQPHWVEVAWGVHKDEILKNVNKAIGNV